MKKDYSIGFMIHKIDNRVKTNIDAQLKANDLTFSQSQILYQLNKHGESMTQKELQDILNVSHPTIVGLVQRLEANDYVKTYTDEIDKRQKIVSLTEKAVAFTKEMDSSRKRNRKKMLKGLDEQQIGQLYELLEILCTNVSE
ncbi:MAG: winged helix DNA-binding protein [Erysipelotrichaceae bacterium]|nr:winged helix DNA-binding protein [Erysipelotrichaceae bacterium]